MRILLVEDEPAISAGIAGALAGAGFRIDTVTDGEDVIQTRRGFGYYIAGMSQQVSSTADVQLMKIVRQLSDTSV